jgi:hypothetical protein
MLVERDCVIERVNTEAVLGKARNVGAEQAAPGGHHETVVGQSLSRALWSRDLHRSSIGVDRLGAALDVVDVDRLEDVKQRRGQGFRLRLIEPRANHQRRLRCDQCDFEIVRRNALNVAQPGGGKGGVHAGEAGAYDD